MATIVHQFLPNGQVRVMLCMFDLVSLIITFLKQTLIATLHIKQRVTVGSFLQLLFMNHKLVRQYEKQLDSMLTGKH